MDLNSSKLSSREIFLNHNWEKYPTLQKSSDTCYGRIVDIEEKEISIQYQFQITKIEASNFLLESLLQKTDWTKILKINDIIQIDREHKKIWLLVPSLVEKHFSDQHHQIQNWHEFLNSVRSFFNAQQFIEVQTPSLVQCPGTEPSLDVFSTELKIGSQVQKLFLPTSPEIHLKKTLCLGYEKIYEIKSCFRNGEITQRHQPEFNMIEWYRTYAPLTLIQEDIKNLIQHLTKHNISIHSKKISDLFQEILNLKLTPQTSREELLSWCQKFNLDFLTEDSWDDLFFRIFIEKIEPAIGLDPTFVTDYPPSQAALARVNAEGWAERFEFYWQGLEIANAFNELNNPQEQRARSQEDLQKKDQLQKEKINLDEDFFNHLEYGMPPSSGIALGLERLFMAIHKCKDIQQIKLFPYY